MSGSSNNASVSSLQACSAQCQPPGRRPPPTHPIADCTLSNCPHWQPRPTHDAGSCRYPSVIASIAFATRCRQGTAVRADAGRQMPPARARTNRAHPRRRAECYYVLAAAPPRTPWASPAGPGARGPPELTAAGCARMPACAPAVRGRGAVAAGGVPARTGSRHSRRTPWCCVCVWRQLMPQQCLPACAAGGCEGEGGEHGTGHRVQVCERSDLTRHALLCEPRQREQPANGQFSSRPLLTCFVAKCFLTASPHTSVCLHHCAS
jgi:hypothetical protein